MMEGEELRSLAARPGQDGRDLAFSFACFRLDADGTLRRRDTVVHLPPKELAALRLLLANAGQIVTPLQLKQSLWGDVHVTADSVPKCLSSLRARLEPEECIQTVYKRGYRFSAEVRRHGPATVGWLPRLAVVPFTAGFNVPEHLGFAVAEETISRLTGARHPVVSLLARDSIFTLAGRGQTAQQIGETLKADLVLTGILRILPSHFRLRAEMIRVEDGTQIWVEDMLVPQNRIAGLELELADRLAFRLSTGTTGDGSSSQGWLEDGLSASVDSAIEAVDESQRREAHEIYQRAHHEWQTLQRHKMQDGLQRLLRATELDPSLIGARVDLVHLCVTQAFYGFMSPAVAAGHVRRVTESIPELPYRAPALLPALGWVSFHVDHDLASTIQAFSLSAHLPHDPWITRLRVMLDLSRHRFAEAIAQLRAAIQADAFSPWLHARLAWALHLAGRAAESAEQARQCLDLFPDHEFAALYGAVILSFNGDAVRGIEIARSLVDRLPYFDLGTAVHAYALACGGREDEARAIVERMQWLSRERFVSSSFTPAVYIALGDPESALAELRTCSEMHCPWFFQMLADPRLKPLHGRPEFERMRAILPRMEVAARHRPELEN